MPFFRVKAGQHVGKQKEIYGVGGVFFDDRMDHARENPAKYEYAHDAREPSGAQPPINVEMTEAERAALFPAPTHAAPRGTAGTPPLPHAPAPGVAEGDGLDDLTVAELDDVIVKEELDVDTKLHKAAKIAAIRNARDAG